MKLRPALAGIAAALCASTLVLGGLAPAHAGKVSLKDEAKDATKYAGTDEPDESRKATRNSVEVQSTVALHQKSSVELNVKVKALGPKDKVYGYFRVVLPGGDAWEGRVSNFPDDRTYFKQVKGGDKTCKGWNFDLQAPNDMVKFGFPRKCIDNPDWFKFGAVLATIDADGNGWTDDALGTGPAPDEPRDVELSGKVPFKD